MWLAYCHGSGHRHYFLCIVQNNSEGIKLETLGKLFNIRTLYLKFTEK